MKKRKKSNYLIYGLIIISAIIIVLLSYFIFPKKKDELVFIFNEASIKLKLGETKKLNYSINNPNSNIEWISNSNIITVNNGFLTANNYGNSIITGIVRDGENTISNTCYVEVYSGEIDVSLDKIGIPEGILLMKENSEFDNPFSIIPSNAYITSLNYYSSDENVVVIENNKIVSKNEGDAFVTLTINNNISSILNIKVRSSIKENKIVKEISNVSFKENDIVMEIGDTKTLSYDINPEDGYINDIKWSSSNENVVTVNNGVIKAINTGESVIKVVVNDKIEDSIIVKVKASDADIKIDYNPKTLIRIGESTNIISRIEPNINEKIVYKSSNSNIAKVNDGVITGINEGVATITLSLNNGKTKSFTINVLPKNGHINGSANLWGYKSLNSKIPVLADSSFYQSLAQKGIGVMQDSRYIITFNGEQFTYDINSNILSVSNKRILVRVYYPKGEDLSKLNTLVYMGGRGETNFDGAFNDIKNNPSMIKSAGIVALLAEGNRTSFDGDSGAYVTKFLKAITKQQNNVKNSILGFSDGAHKVLHAANKETYDKIIIYSGYTDGAAGVENAKNSEIIFMIGSSDGNYSQAKSALNNMINSGYKNLTFVSMGNDLSKYENNALVINPGNLMKNGHYSVNVFNSGIIEYAND